MNYATATAVTFGAKAVALALAAVTAVALARWLGPDARGDYAVITLVPQTVVTLANLGLGLATVRRIGQNASAAKAAASNALVFSLAGGALALALALLFAGPLEDAYPALHWYLWLVVLAIPQALAYLLLQALLQATRAFVASAVLVVASYLLQLGSLAVFLGVLALGLPGAVTAWFIAHLTLALLTCGVLAVRIGFARPDATMLLTDVRFGIVSWLGTLATLVTTRAGVFVAGAVLAPAAVGVLAVGITVAELIWTLPEAAAFSLAPFVARFGVDRSTLITPLVTRVVLMLSAATAGLVWVMATPIAAVFGPGFEDVASVLRWLLPGVAVFGIAKVLAADLIGRGRPAQALPGLAVGAVAALAVALALARTTGVNGVAASATLAYALSALLLVVAYVRLTRRSAFDLLVIRREDLALLLARGRAAFS